MKSFYKFYYLLLIAACIFSLSGKLQVYAGQDSGPDPGSVPGQDPGSVSVQDLGSVPGQDLGSVPGQDRPVRVLCYGDSNTYGFDPDPYADRYPESVRWTGVLQEQLGDGFQIIEEGKNGRATGYQPGQGSDVPDIQEEVPDAVYIPPSQEGPQDLLARLEIHQPVDILVIILGTNDCHPSYGLTAEEVAAGMEALVNTAESWAARYSADETAASNNTGSLSIVIIAPPVMDDEILNTPGISQEAADYIRKSRAIGELYRQIAVNHNCTFVDARDGIELSPLDHLHLTEKGHAQLAQQLADVLGNIAR